MDFCYPDAKKRLTARKVANLMLDNIWSIFGIPTVIKDQISQDHGGGSSVEDWESEQPIAKLIEHRAMVGLKWLGSKFIIC